MRPGKPLSLRLPLLLLALGFLFACHLTTSSESEQAFTFPALADSVQGADHVIITLKDSSGTLIDVLFDGPVTAATSFKTLKAPNYKGGIVHIAIEATKDGKPIYAVKQTWDGDKGVVTQSSIVVARSPSVDLLWPTPRLREGDSLLFPSVTVLPVSLEDRRVRFVSRAPSLLKVGDTHFHALLQGRVTVVAMLLTDTLVRDSVEVEILSKDALGLLGFTLSPKPLILAVKGPKGRFTVTANPPGAALDLEWTALDPTLVTVSESGLLTAFAEGQGRIVAASKQNIGVSDTATVQVLPPQAVDSVRFERDTLEVFVGGTPDSLLARVYPPLANPNVTFSLADGTLARIQNGKVEALIEGETWVIAQSVQDPSKRDSLRLVVFPKDQVDSVRVKPDTLRLFMKGLAGALTASIHPATLQARFRWSVTDPAIAAVDGSGGVSPGAPGKTYITAAARADASKKDSALIIVVKDTPRLSVGADTVVSAGSTVTHRPQVTQEYGEVVLFRWDLDGNGVYDDSATSVPVALPHAYTETKVHTARFHVRDSEGNDTTVFRKVSAVEGRVVQITSPKDSSYTNQSQIVVSWLVDGEPYTNSETLKAGANTVTRSAKDAAGNTFSHSVTVILDQTAPGRPVVSGPTVPVNTLTPTWTWKSGGGGSGVYRSRLGEADLSGAVASQDTFFTVPQNLTGGTHTLYVQECDAAGNWSLTGSFAIRIDTTAPAAPTVSVNPSGATNNTRPTWSWTGGVGDAYRYYRFKLGDDDFRSGGRDTVGTSYQPPALSEGTHTLYVQVRDSAGNWSQSAQAAVTVDLTAPTAPTVSVSPAALTNDATPTWSWRRGTGGNGTFRFKLNSSDLSTGATTTTDTAHTPAPLGEGTYMLYVQERDAAGNWSPSGSRQVRLDLTAPTPPRLDSTPYSPLNSLRPRWTWRSGTGGAKVFRAKVDDPNLTGAAEQTDSSFTPAQNLTEGPHFLYVQERDSAGNWSTIVQRRLVLLRSGHIGPEGFSKSTAFNISLGLAEGVIPVAAYRTEFEGVIVQKFNGTDWVPHGSIPIDPNSGYAPKLAYGYTGAQFLAYGQTSANKSEIVVRKYNGNGWDLLAEPIEDLSGTSRFSMGISPRNEDPIIARIFHVDNIRSIVSVLRISGGKVNHYGTVSDSAKGKSKPSIAFDHSDIPYVAYPDLNSGGKLTVRFKSGVNWLPIGGSGISKGAASDPVLKVSKLGHLYVLFIEDFGGPRISLLRFAGGSWTYIGEGGIPANTSQNPAASPWNISLAIDDREHPVIAYSDYSDDGFSKLPKVVTYRNSEWMSLGRVHSNIEFITDIALALNSDGVPYLGFRDNANMEGRAIVYKLGFDPESQLNNR